MTFLRKSGSLVMFCIKPSATAAQCSFCSGTNFATTCFMPRSCVKISDTIVFGIPRSASGSHTVSCWSLLIAAGPCPTFSGVLLVAGLPEHRSPNRFSTIFEAFVPHFYLCCTHYIIPRSLLTHPNSFRGGMFKLYTKLDSDLLLYLLSHFECSGHTAHTTTLTDWYSEVVLVHHAHSIPLSLAATLYQCRANHSCYINNGWTFSGQTLYVENWSKYFLYIKPFNHHNNSKGGSSYLLPQFTNEASRS